MRIEPAEKISKIKLVENNFYRITTDVLNNKSLQAIYKELNFDKDMEYDEFVALSQKAYQKSKSEDKKYWVKNCMIGFFILILIGALYGGWYFKIF